ncbi:hypothetical protein [Undibacterium sp. WLX3042]|uniref:hypothetical protein n=1 Tax=Undibacterium sp. WLX3042 TaxID=3412686 RepID=UPI003C30E308
MSLRKRKWKSLRATSISDATELCLDYATENHRRPAKVLADLMGIDVKLLYRWMSDSSMPLNRIRQFETFCGASYISEYLCTAHGDKIVIDIPSGKKSNVTDLAEVQANFAEAIALLARFYQNGDDVEKTVSVLTRTLSELGYQRNNVIKVSQPELALFGSDR